MYIKKDTITARAPIELDDGNFCKGEEITLEKRKGSKSQTKTRKSSHIRTVLRDLGTKTEPLHELSNSTVMFHSSFLIFHSTILDYTHQNMHRILFLFMCCFITFTSCIEDQAHVITGDVSINCGSTGNSAARGGREWMGDAHPKFTSSLQIKGTPTVSTVVSSSISDDPIPYKTARISRSAFSYSFLVNPGQKFIRLHFNPTPYKGFKRLKDVFTVETGSFILLSNFSASLTADALGLTSFTKEFCISTEENQPLNIIFSPANNQQSKDTYAFVNGIEIIPVPSGHSYFHDGGEVGAKVVGRSSQLFYIDNTTALELVHRVNIKRDSVSVVNDFRDMFGTWAMNPKVKANEINNITWKVSVDVGFRYLVRIQLSELGLKITETGAVIFKVLINEIIADTNIDIVKERDANGDLNYRDYVVMMKGRKEEGRHDLLVSLQSYDEFMDGYGPIMGFQIFKLSNPDNSLVGPNPLPPARDLPSSTVQTLFSIIGQRNAIATAGIIIFALINIIVHKLREICEANRTEEEIKPSVRAERFCRRFSLAEMQLATRNFSDTNIIGKGGFGRVYKGFIDNGRETVAIKQLKAHSRQGAREFLAEIETLSELRHINLVSLIGYCNEHGEMILVYEYMACGTLADHLYKLERNGNSSFSLNWKQRLNICIGAGRGLDYLHTGHAVIHRDVKVSNILLDENLTAKVSDFGLVKHENRNNLQSHVSTKVMGTWGYFDPNYFSTGKLTRKSDTYSFGVVLLEVLCGRPALDPRVATDEQVLTKWAQDKISKGEVDLIVASSLREEILPDSLKAFVEVVARCLDDDPKKRPTMAQVVLQLEVALNRQETTISLVPHEETSDAPCNDETNFSVSEQITMTSIDEPIPTSSQRAQTNYRMDFSDSVFRQKDGRKVMTDKPPRLWPWVALWNRVKQSKKNEFSIAAEDEIITAESLQYDFGRIRTATNDFSYSNKLGEGGFGAVYRGILPNGQEIAVKRLPTDFGQTVAEFKNELLLLARLQHRNLVRLLGFSIKGNEKLLVYEFVENLSLDQFIFDPIKGSNLDWERRYEIIRGIAKGLLYLHEDSQLRIIHQDIKAGNVLLDRAMNPKIADFGMARLFVSNETQGNTSRIVGTYGYMSPEYAIHGQFSVKSDVFSFGVLVLEIISGQKNNSFRNGEVLLSCAWKFWRQGTAANMIDPVLMAGSANLRDMLRCIHIGLLCVQGNPANRPTIADVIIMLSSFSLTLPVPFEPAYFCSSSNGLDNLLVSESDSADLYPR